VNVSFRDEIRDHIYSEIDFRIPDDFSTSTAPAGHSLLNTFPVRFLSDPEKLPAGFIPGIPQGSKEFFANQANLRYNESGPLTAAVHLALGQRGVDAYSLIVGGAQIIAKFPLSNFYGLEERNHGPDDAAVVCKINPASIILPPNKCVSDWKPITTQFPDLHLEAGASVDWDTKQILVRYRLRITMSEDSNKPVLILEGLVLPTGTWEGVAESKKETLSSDFSSALRLWGSENCAWYSSLPPHKLPTAPGISRVSMVVPLPTELEYRWFIHTVLHRCSGGKSVESKQEFESYVEKPYPTGTAPFTTCFLPFPFGTVETVTTDTPDLAPAGGLPRSLSEGQLQANLSVLHEQNDRCKHPSQAQNRIITMDSPLATAASGTHSTNHTNTINLSSPATREDFLLPQQGDQEVTRYCPVSGCTWSSFKTFDKSMLETCVKELSIHVQYEHSSSVSSPSGSSNTGRADKAHAEYIAATKARNILKTVDDATTNLCEARFFPMPLDRKALGQNMPPSIIPVNTIVDMSHVGVDVTSAETLRKCQDRTLITKKLKDFSDSNLRSYHAAEDALVAVHTGQNSLKLGKEVKQLESTQECVRAFYNFCALSQNFFVLDWSPMALMKLVLEKQFAGPPSVEQYTRMFEKFVHDCAIRAQKKAPPPTYQELCVIWNTFIVPSTSTVSMTMVDNRIDQKILQLSKQTQANPRGGRGAGAGGGPSPKMPKLTKDDYCQTWNSSSSYPPCTNQAVDGGCLDSSGKILKHACNFYNKGTNRLCRSDKHGFHFH